MNVRAPAAMSGASVLVRRLSLADKTRVARLVVVAASGAERTPLGQFVHHAAERQELPRGEATLAIPRGVRARATTAAESQRLRPDEVDEMTLGDGPVGFANDGETREGVREIGARPRHRPRPRAVRALGKGPVGGGASRHRERRLRLLRPPPDLHRGGASTAAKTPRSNSRRNGPRIRPSFRSRSPRTPVPRRWGRRDRRRRRSGASPTRRARIGGGRRAAHSGGVAWRRHGSRRRRRRVDLRARRRRRARQDTADDLRDDAGTVALVRAAAVTEQHACFPVPDCPKARTRASKPREIHSAARARGRRGGRRWMRRPRSGTREGARGTYRRGGACGSCTADAGRVGVVGEEGDDGPGTRREGVRLAAGRAKRRGAERRGAHRAVHGRGTHRDVRSPAERFQLGGHRADVFGHVRVPQRTAALRASGRFRGCDGRAGQRGRASARRGGETEARGREKTHAHLARREKHAAARSRCRSRPVDRRAAESAVELMRPIPNGSRAAHRIAEGASCWSNFSRWCETTARPDPATAGVSLLRSTLAISSRPNR